MKINSIAFYTYKTNFTSDSKKNVTLPSVKEYASTLPDSVDEVYAMPWEVRQQVEKNYQNKLFETYFDKNGKVIPQIKDFLDSNKFDIEVPGGLSNRFENKTLKDYINENLFNKRDFIPTTLYHGSSSSFEKIKENGFDPKYIRRTSIGPGFYFSDYGVAHEFGSIVEVDIENAKMAYSKPEFYLNVPKCSAQSRLCNFLDLDTLTYLKSGIHRDFCSTLINEYCRDYIVNELGIDIIDGSCGDALGYCYCVLNPKVIKNIR